MKKLLHSELLVNNYSGFRAGSTFGWENGGLITYSTPKATEAHDAEKLIVKSNSYVE